MISTNEWSILNRWMNYDEECCKISVTQFVMKYWKVCCDEYVMKNCFIDCWMKYEMNVEINVVMKYLSLNLCWKFVESLWCMMCWKFVEESSPDFDECCEVNVVKWMLWSECCEVNVKFVHHISFIIWVNML